MSHIRSRDSNGAVPARNLALAAVIVLLATISVTAAGWCLARGYTLYYGDAEAHLNIARRVVDSRTLNGKQLGTVWLPLPHLLMAPFVIKDAWWRSGLAGVIPSAACYVLAGAFLFASARRVYRSGIAALAVVLLFALNPNVLYLQSTPMTEVVFAAALAGLLWATLRFRDAQSRSQAMLALLAAAAASIAASLTRYEGWVLIPIVTLYLFFTTERKGMAVLFGALASLAPLAWLAHNQFYWNDPLEFYHGPYSAIVIQKTTYPGEHDWKTALDYYAAAVRLVAGWPLVVIGLCGAIVALASKPARWPLLMLAIPPAFYVWSVHSAGVPIFVPGRPYAHSWYNTRYAVAALPLLAMAGGALIARFRARWQWAAAGLVAMVPAVAWAASGDAPSICWKESQVNSVARRAWTSQAAQFLAAHYKPRTGVLLPFGDATGILREAGIPLRDALHDGNGPAWDAALARPALFLHEEWAVGLRGDEVSRAMKTAGPRYSLRKQIIVEGAPVVEIYQRQ